MNFMDNKFLRIRQILWNAKYEILFKILFSFGFHVILVTVKLGKKET